MATPVSHVAALVDRWFRALDQRPIRVGLHEWVLHITGIWVESDAVWIQIADGSGRGGSVVLQVDAATSSDQAIQALSARLRDVRSRPLIISVNPVQRPRSTPSADDIVHQPATTTP